MAAERLPMRKLREIIRLKLQAGQSGRAIARSCGLSPSTVAEYAGRIALAGLSWPLAPELDDRSEEHTSELQSRRDLVCRLLLEKKKKKKKKIIYEKKKKKKKKTKKKKTQK